MKRALELMLMLAFAAPGARALAQISPGPLASPHQHLEGAANCGQCHARRSSVSQQCSNCHRDIGWLVARGRGVHARAAAAKKECASCHPDHAGRNFALISWPAGAAERFDHREAGWALEQSHRDVKCDECHVMQYRSGPAAALSKRKLSPGWIGLETACLSCHREDDAHKGSLSSGCETCHDAGDWRRAGGFSHDSTAYALTGKHREVACDACHAAAKLVVRRDAKGEPIPVYKPVPFQECSACHRDPHQGRLSPRCGECHTTDGFDGIDRRAFNHALTRYPLKGRHARVSCAGCHGASMETPSPPFGTCAVCHADPHQGEATLRHAPADCAACHRLDGFAPSAYTAKEHASAPYALEGRHLTVPCGGCHRAVTANGAPRPRHLRMPFAKCEDCHADAHGTQLAGQAEGARCAACHAVRGWTPALYTAKQHAALRLPLEGRHAELACNACHSQNRAGLPPDARVTSRGAANVSLRLDPGCGSCHVDAHDRRFASRGAVTCSDCHGWRQWSPSSVDARMHDTFTFRLEGAHRAVACSACHGELKAQRRLASTLLSSSQNPARLPFAARGAVSCESCHETPHGTQFAGRKGGGTCDACHSPQAFVPADRFDHERDAAFSLKGAHARVRCARCHVAPSGATATSVRYRPLSTKCETCHSGEVTP